jgi:hypothetical protein
MLKEEMRTTLKKLQIEKQSAIRSFAANADKDFCAVSSKKSFIKIQKINRK